MRPIGIFDSGVGGLTVVKEVMKALPHEEIIYFGDTARVPYGSKSKETVTKYSKQIVHFLMEQDIKLVIIACGTASSNSYNELARDFSLPIFEMVANGVEACLEATKNKTVGVIATEATIRSKAYERGLKESCPDITVYSKPCPLFVPLVEEGWTNNTVAGLTAEIYLQDLIDKKIDALIMGCTHYPFLLESIRRVTGGISIINPAVRAAEKVGEYLEKNSMERTSGEPPRHKFYTSDYTEKFSRLCRICLGRDYEAEIIDIDQY